MPPLMHVMCIRGGILHFVLAVAEQASIRRRKDTAHIRNMAAVVAVRLCGRASGGKSGAG